MFAFRFRGCIRLVLIQFKKLPKSVCCKSRNLVALNCCSQTTSANFVKKRKQRVRKMWWLVLLQTYFDRVCCLFANFTFLTTGKKYKLAVLNPPHQHMAPSFLGKCRAGSRIFGDLGRKGMCKAPQICICDIFNIRCSRSCFLQTSPGSQLLQAPLLQPNSG